MSREHALKVGRAYSIRKVVNFDRELLAAVHRWRRQQETRPSANVAIRALISRGLAASQQARLRDARP
jgi:hypothetical protein